MNVAGLFDSDTPNTLIISQAFVMGLENAKLLTTIQATSFLLAATALHEYVHYGNFAVGFYPPPGTEMGEAFERAGFTTDINRTNAYEILKLYFSK